MKFNINHNIKVRLTDLGRAIHEKQHDTVLGNMRYKYPYNPPKEDENGWSKWQLWDFMATFGPYMGNGCDMPAETEIEILEETS